jgi:hypothetical protein
MVPRLFQEVAVAPANGFVGRLDDVVAAARRHENARFETKRAFTRGVMRLQDAQYDRAD